MTGDDWYIVITEMDSDHWLENLFLMGLTIHIFTVASANSHGLDFSALCGRHAIAQSIPEKSARSPGTRRTHFFANLLMVMGHPSRRRRAVLHFRSPTGQHRDDQVLVQWGCPCDGPRCCFRRRREQRGPLHHEPRDR